MQTTSMRNTTNKLILSARNSFTLVELLVVISIISLLASIVFASLNGARGKARYARILGDFNAMRTAAELDADVRGGAYAADLCPNQNPFPQYLPLWPQPPCPGWSYDWENWGNGETIRITMRDDGLTSCSGGTRKYYFCIFTTGNCTASDGINITTVADKSISC